MQFGFTPAWARSSSTRSSPEQGDHRSTTTPATAAPWASCRSRCSGSPSAPAAASLWPTPSRRPPARSSPSPTSSTPAMASAPFGRHLGRMDGHRHRRTRAVFCHHHGHRLRHPAGHRPPPVRPCCSTRRRQWIDPVTPLGDVTALLRPIPDGTLNAYPIDPGIKNPRLNGTTLLQPPASASSRSTTTNSTSRWRCLWANPARKLRGRESEAVEQPLLTPRRFPPPCS